MIVVTGAAGFIGSCLVGKLNNKGFKDIVLVDDFSRNDKNRNIEFKAFREKVHRDLFFGWCEKHGCEIDFMFHIGARTDTAEFDKSIFDRLNLNYSKSVWELCAKNNIPLVYASSAATYGMGDLGYKDDHQLPFSLKPLNPYGESKNEFDKWAILQKNAPPFWAGLKFFNVYGPNEYHKGRMASVIFHSFHQIRNNGAVSLFRSHNPAYEDGGQLRDFIYVKDVVDVMYFLMQRGKESGLFNLGTGKARTFLDLAGAVFRAMDEKENIRFIDTPVDIREKYQYFTEADMSKLTAAGYDFPFYSLEEGIEEYVAGFLTRNRWF